ncbi:MAG: hypothetical protein KKG75_01530, partial [Nanoarchaeota archaeon]|nr:hypothetical protein [Nanoarchaeota archaeon]
KFWRKFCPWAKEMEMEDWKWMDEFIKLQKKIKAKGEIKSEDEKITPDYTYIKDLVAGRPVLGHPLAKGGFRLRYGRSRLSGFSCDAIHPATMKVLENYIASGTQLKMERPAKGNVLSCCDSIEGPIVKLKNGSVVYLGDEVTANRYVKEIEEVLFLGDILINYGDFFNRAHKLVPPGYCEEWWLLEFEKKIQGKGIVELSEEYKIDKELLKKIFKGNLNISGKEAVELSKKLKINLHPKYTYHWNEINKNGLISLLKWLERGSIKKANENIEKIILPFKELNVDEEDPKRVLELIGVPHLVVSNEYVVIEEDDANALIYSLGFDSEFKLEEIMDNKDEGILKVLNKKAKLRDKSGIFIGARMGRPEKAKMRKMVGSPHCLFPIGEEGGRLRCFQSALEQGKVISDFPVYECGKCGKRTIFSVCERCGIKAQKLYYCNDCGDYMNEKCKQKKRYGDKEIEHDCRSYKNQEIDLGTYFSSSLKKLGIVNYPDLIKGVRGTSNEDHFPENFSKGILRAMDGLYVNKDGTVRYDMTEMTITHFKPKEIGTSIEKLKELGYNKDVNGNELIDEEQIVEILPQDIILPACEESPDETSDEILFRISKFVDNLLVRFYGLNNFYNLQNKEDLRGHLILAMSPHTSAGILGRIIGFSKLQGFLAHPYLHSIMRRDCVYPSTKFVYYDCEKEELINGEIGNYIEDLIKGGMRTSVIDSVGTLRVECGKKLFALGIDPETRNLVYKKIKYFIKGPVTKKWVKITTATNREYVMTPTHKFMYLSEDNKKFKFKDAIDAKVNDKISVLDKLDVPLKSKDKIDLIKLFSEKLREEDKKNILLIDKNYEFYEFAKSIGRKRLSKLLGRRIRQFKPWIKYVTLYDYEKLGLDVPDLRLRCKFSKFELDRYFNISNEFCDFLGYYLSEGHSRSNRWVSQLSFRICNLKMQKKLKNLIRYLFNKNINVSDDRIVITNKLIYYLLNSLEVGNGAYSKRVPSFIFSLSKKKILGFISSYFEGDGAVNIPRSNIAFYSVNHSLLEDIALLLLRFGIIGRYFKTKPRLPGKEVLERYRELGKEPKMHILHHFIVSGKDATSLKNLLLMNKTIKDSSLLKIRNSEIRSTQYNRKQVELISASDYFGDYVKKVEIIEDNKNSYCVEIDWKSKEDRNILWGDQIINTRCDGDEACVVLLMDALLNFSRKLLPSHRGARQDAPLVLTTKLIPKEVDDMIFDMDIVWKYPLEFYEACEKYKDPWEIKIEQVKDRLGSEGQYEDFGFTHDVSNFNIGVRCSSYKSLPTMQEKVIGQMAIAEKVRAVDENDVARLVIERHFIRDIRGNLRKFSQQQFRCVGCNEKYRRPPLIGRCLKCNGRIIFTISEGSIVKYVEPAMSLIDKYELPSYLKQSLELTKMMIESTFSKDPDKQEGLGKWF